MKDMTTHVIAWQKSSFSNEVGSCVKLVAADGTLRLRESDDPHVTAATTPPRLRAPLRGVTAGAFDRLGADA